MRPDSEIIAEVLAGRREGFHELVERHGRALLGYVQRRVADADEARELFQETLVRAFEGLAGLRDPARLRPWLYSIAHNALARRGRRPTALALDDVTPPAAPAETPALEREEERARVERAVAALPPRQREVFELRAVGELSHAEIAGELGISEENARANYYQAVRRLRTELGG